jgi:hypothetical protein
MLRLSSSQFGPYSDIGPGEQAHRAGPEGASSKPPRFRTIQVCPKDRLTLAPAGSLMRQTARTRRFPRVV